MRYSLILVTILLFGLTNAFTPYEQEIQECLTDIGLYPTGLNDAFEALPIQMTQVRDTHWSICESTILEFSDCFGDGSPDPLTGCCSSYALPFSSSPALDTWIHPINEPSFTPTSWITWQGFGDIRGDLTFQTTFQSESAGNLTMRCWADNSVVRVELDNEDIDFTWNAHYMDYRQATDFSFNVKEGSHNLAITLNNAGNIGGLLVSVSSCFFPPPPTEAPTESPTEAPTESPTETPSEAPSAMPTEAPTETPKISCEDNTCLECNDTTGCTFDGDYVVPLDLPSALIITTPTVINGDFTNNGNVVLVLTSDTFTSLNISGCLILTTNSSLSIDVSDIDKSSNKRINAILSPCFNGTVDVVNKNEQNECADVTPEKHAGGLDILILSKDDCSNNNMPIILGATIGAIVLAILVFFVVVFSVPSLRQSILPWNLRETQLDTVRDVTMD